MLDSVSSIEKQSERLLTASDAIMRNLYSQYTAIKDKARITKSQIIALEYIARKKECTMNELSKLTGFALGALTGIIDRMIAKGLVRRRRDGADRRVVKVYATEKGTTLANEYYQNKLEIVKQLLSKIEQADRENFVSMIEKVAGYF
ncbi:MAG: MarR family winged helix-turn-helix transcriptional regulator [Spirochaetota bacterium]